MAVATKGVSVPLLGTALPRSMLQVLPLGASVYVAPFTVTVRTSPSILHHVPVITGVVSMVLSEVTVGRFSAIAVVLLPAASVTVAVILLYLVKPPLGMLPLTGATLAVLSDQAPPDTSTW